MKELTISQIVQQRNALINRTTTLYLKLKKVNQLRDKISDQYNRSKKEYEQIDRQYWLEKNKQDRKKAVERKLTTKSTETDQLKQLLKILKALPVNKQEEIIKKLSV